MSEHKTYHLWITAPDATYESILVSKLVERGYSISASDGSSTSTKSENGFSVLIALKVERLSGKSFSVDELHNHVMAIITEVNGTHYSVITTPFSQDTLWCASNVGLTALAKTTNTNKGLN